MIGVLVKMIICGIQVLVIVNVIKQVTRALTGQRPVRPVADDDFEI